MMSYHQHPDLVLYHLYSLQQKDVQRALNHGNTAHLSSTKTFKLDGFSMRLQQTLSARITAPAPAAKTTTSKTDPGPELLLHGIYAFDKWWGYVGSPSSLLSGDSYALMPRFDDHDWSVCPHVRIQASTRLDRSLILGGGPAMTLESALREGLLHVAKIRLPMTVGGGACRECWTDYKVALQCRDAHDFTRGVTLYVWFWRNLGGGRGDEKWVAAVEGEGVVRSRRDGGRMQDVHGAWLAAAAGLVVRAKAKAKAKKEEVGQEVRTEAKEKEGEVDQPRLAARQRQEGAKVEIGGAVAENVGSVREKYRRVREWLGCHSASAREETTEETGGRSGKDGETPPPPYC